MERSSWIETLLEITSKPLSAVFGLIETAVGIPTHEGLHHQLAVEVFNRSHFRRLDKRSPDSTIPIGAVLRVKRTGYRHYAVGSDPGQVIHYTGVDGDFGQMLSVQETEIARFIGTADRFEILDFADAGDVFSSDQTVARARSRIGEAEYGFLDHNCQHFAFWCKTGRSVSAQAPFWSRMGRGGAAALGGALPALPVAPDLIAFYGVRVERVIFAAAVLPARVPRTTVL